MKDLWPKTHLKKPATLVRKKQDVQIHVCDLAALSFSHPDYTVGPGITPGPPHHYKKRSDHRMITTAIRVTD